MLFFLILIAIGIICFLYHVMPDKRVTGIAYPEGVHDEYRFGRHYCHHDLPLRNLTGIILLTALCLVSCTSEQETEKEALMTEVNISLDSAKFQKVYDFIDHWNQDSLLPYLSHRDPSFRVLATTGFSGMMDDIYIDTIGSGINDPITEVRRATAYSLGQSNSNRAVPYLMQIFENQDSMGIDPLTFKYALEAVGKCADSSYLSLLAGISTYQPGDTLLLEGQCLGILNMAERGFSDTAATSLMIRYMGDTTFASSVRLIASNYLAAVESLDLSAYHEAILQAYENEEDPEIRMFIVKAMSKTGSQAESWIRRTLRNEDDDRVRIALLRGSVALPLSVRHRIWAGALRDQNDLVAQAAADLILEYGSSGYSETYTNWAFASYKPEVYARILGAGNKYITNDRFRQMIQDLIFRRLESTSDPYNKSDFVMAAGQRLSTSRQLVKYDGEDVPAIVRTSILEALVKAVNTAGHIGSPERRFLIERWDSGDVAALSVLSPFFATNKTLFPELTADEERWTAQSNKIKMPEGIEARLAIDKARQQLFGADFDPLFYRKATFHTHDIDWDLYEQLSDHPTADIVTSVGTFTIQLYKKTAPATVVNFIQLAESGYYDNKLIHRVVPNFVIQGGGNRGDGYGSMDYTIRSEVGPQYYDKSGLVGMASAGLHTESQQWFVTLRPTLHLNGRYTQFAAVTAGKEVLPKIRRGDQITTIKIYR